MVNLATSLLALSQPQNVLGSVLCSQHNISLCREKQSSLGSSLQHQALGKRSSREANTYRCCLQFSASLLRCMVVSCTAVLYPLLAVVTSVCQIFNIRIKTFIPQLFSFPAVFNLIVLAIEPTTKSMLQLGR